MKGIFTAANVTFQERGLVVHPRAIQLNVLHHLVKLVARNGVHPDTHNVASLSMIWAAIVTRPEHANLSITE